jgi:hypothetical protein
LQACAVAPKNSTLLELSFEIGQRVFQPRVQSECKLMCAKP